MRVAKMIKLRVEASIFTVVALNNTLVVNTTLMSAGYCSRN